MHVNSDIQFLSFCMRGRIHLCHLEHSAGKASVEFVLWCRFLSADLDHNPQNSQAGLLRLLLGYMWQSSNSVLCLQHWTFAEWLSSLRQNDQHLGYRRVCITSKEYFQEIPAWWVYMVLHVALETSLTPLQMPHIYIGFLGCKCPLLWLCRFPQHLQSRG